MEQKEPDFPRIDSSTRLINSHHDSYQSSSLRREYCDSGELLSSVRRSGRRPFHYPVSQGHIQPDPDLGIAATYNRYRYYSRLVDHSIDTLSIPDHVIPDYFFHPFLLSPKAGTQSSIVTIFAMWNTMMGTSLLSMPWAIEKAGFSMGIFLLVFMGILCAYTAYRILDMPNLSGLTDVSLEFSDICSHYLGNWAKWFSLTFSLLPLIGGAIVYWVLMSNFLYHSVLFFYETVSGEMSETPNNSSLDVFCVVSEPVDTNTSFLPANATLPNDIFYKLWDLDKTVPVFLALCIGPMISLKSPTFFAKFNALGTVSVMYLCIFAIVKASQWGSHFTISDIKSPDYVPLFQSSFPALTGILSMAYFIHNGVLTLCRNQRNPQNNARDLIIAFILVTITYLVIGSIFFIYFPLPKDCIQDNILNNFHPTDAMAMITRVFLLFQLLTVFPLIIYWTRIQFMHAVFHAVYPSGLHVFILNAFVLMVCILFSIYMPHIGTIIRYCGALAGLAYIFTLPSILYLKAMFQKGRLSALMTVTHLVIVFLGVANFVAQFFV